MPRKAKPETPETPLPTEVENTEVTESLSLYTASAFLSGVPFLSPKFASLVRGVEQELDMPVWLLIQGGQRIPENTLSNELRDLFVLHESELPKNTPVALIMDSPGGSADSAYRIARLLQRRCGSFVAVIPQWAKSAATLLAFGADRVIIGRHGELGPLDVQLLDENREIFVSALNTAKTLEQLNRFALDVFYSTYVLLKQETIRPVDTLVPFALEYASELCQPLFAQVNVVQYTQTIRDLTIAKDYAYRLLTDKFEPEMAWEIVSHFVEHYPAHGFVIDDDEAAVFLPSVEKPTETLDNILSELYPHLYKGQFTAVGLLQEINEGAENNNDEEGNQD